MQEKIYSYVSISVYMKYEVLWTLFIGWGTRKILVRWFWKLGEYEEAVDCSCTQSSRNVSVHQISGLRTHKDLLYLSSQKLEASRLNLTQGVSTAKHPSMLWPQIPAWLQHSKTLPCNQHPWGPNKSLSSSSLSSACQC